MKTSDVAKYLNISIPSFEIESKRSFVARKILEIKTEIFSIANKYGIKSLKEFESLIKKGKIRETSESRDDFYRLDYLESRLGILNKILRTL
ncbi:MAG: hypothetical protein US50_C0042G0006 [Candidatus Nomurabacteria bacterium GW2011_GWB1_37_5]|uniref:Uncharacterized protein n=1 Tax=Candidatus Nomurabacteria bacterium GW2011_GWB1_37_5 TaxID=1618742 RepID=A0A0G0GX35_9BACT|nr:MAG: hypothetical protein US50_C0042G0006 [Candidatus Nomurabacteria bacterium GW2011_GWB1_37_5]